MRKPAEEREAIRDHAISIVGRTIGKLRGNNEGLIDLKEFLDCYFKAIDQYVHGEDDGE